MADVPATGRLWRTYVRLLTSARSWVAGRRSTDLPPDRPRPDIDRVGSPNWTDYRDFAARQPLTQPDGTTCGSCALVMARMINDPAFGATVTDPSNGDDAHAASAFAAAVRAMHRATGAMHDPRGGWTLPWPTFLGTQPLAVARQMSGPGGSGRGAARYGVHVIDPRDPAPGYAKIVSAVDGGDTVPLFLGDAKMARHVVLVTGHHPAAGDGPLDAGTQDGGLDLYDPSAGHWVEVPGDRFLSGHIDVAGWSQAWFAILPAG